MAGDLSLPYSKQRALLALGDVLLWEGKGLVSSAIRWRTGGRYSHASMVDVDERFGVRRVWVLESREGKGIQHVPLSNLLRQGHRIAWYTHRAAEGADGIAPLDREAMAAWAIDRVGDRYDYGAILTWARSVWPWSRVRLSRDDDLELTRTAVCSAYVSGAAAAGGRDLVMGRAHQHTSPADLERSALLRYRGHLEWDA